MDKIKSLFKKILNDMRSSKNSTFGDCKIKEADIFKRFASFVVDFIIITFIFSFMFTIAYKDKLDEILITAKDNITVEEITIDPDGKKKSEVKVQNFKKNTERLKSAVEGNNNFFYMFSGVLVVYFYLSIISKNRATPGQRLFNLITVSTSDNKKSIYINGLNKSILLFASICLRWFPFLIILPLLFFKNKTFCDYLSGTEVLEIIK